ncbi:hypothetical protein C0Q70_03339 [Pomacea canaliculata]|uniref:Sushi domain-containing protein n=1 Tax=Pomacea canaliculata TaxID=400727 RepID=A0A2T7PSG3_POMCA|nr:hypothetical protein C0Q70_03339 [Pomacea canaliculata]
MLDRRSAVRLGMTSRLQSPTIIIQSPECSTLPSVLDVTTSNVTFGTSVNVSCSQFGYRLVGAPTLTCNKSAQWEPTVPTCEYFSQNEKEIAFMGCYK